MTGHYCSEHGVTFFRKGKMKNYAHPIEGTKPIKWCNEPEDGGEPEPERTTPKEIAPQEKGMWWKEVGENFRAKLFDKDDKGNGSLLWRAYVTQMMTSLEIKFDKKKD